MRGLVVSTAARPTPLNACAECGKFTDFRKPGDAGPKPVIKSCSVCHADYHSCCAPTVLKTSVTEALVVSLYVLEALQRPPWERKGFLVCTHCTDGCVDPEVIYESRAASGIVDGGAMTPMVVTAPSSGGNAGGATAVEGASSRDGNVGAGAAAPTDPTTAVEAASSGGADGRGAGGAACGTEVEAPAGAGTGAVVEMGGSGSVAAVAVVSDIATSMREYFVKWKVCVWASVGSLAAGCCYRRRRRRPRCCRRRCTRCLLLVCFYFVVCCSSLEYEEEGSLP